MYYILVGYLERYIKNKVSLYVKEENILILGEYSPLLNLC